MYKGKNWEIVLPVAVPVDGGSYSIDGTTGDGRLRALDFRRERDPVYPDDEREALVTAEILAVEAARQKGQNLSQGKLIGFAYAEHKPLFSWDSMGIFQLMYLIFGAAAYLVDHGDPSAKGYGSNLGYMATVRTTDNRSIHSTRRKEVASWAGFDGLFGGGLAGDENGDATKLAIAGISRVTELAQQRVATELGLERKDILETRLLGVVEGDKYLDHTINYDMVVDRTADDLLKDKSALLSRPAVNQKYADIFAINTSDPEGLISYLEECGNRIVEVGLGGLVLTGTHLFGNDFVQELRRRGIIEN